MPKTIKPWFRTSKQTWYATLNGRKLSLGIQGEANEAEAVKAWHRLMAGVQEAKQKAKPKASTVKQVIDGFLADAEGRVSPACLRNYRLFLLPFAKRFGSRLAEALTVAEAEAFARKPEWSMSYRNGMLGALVSAYRWAERTGLLSCMTLCSDWACRLRFARAAGRGSGLPPCRTAMIIRCVPWYVGFNKKGSSRNSVGAF